MLGSKIKEYRRQNNYSQRDLAELLNVSAKSVGRWEQNKTKPSFDELKRLAQVLGVSDIDLLRDDNEQSAGQGDDSLVRISDGVDNLVTGQDNINRSIISGQEGYHRRQDELIRELRSQNAELLKRIEDNKRNYDLQKELLKQKKIRNAILLFGIIMLIILMCIFMWFFLNYGPDPNVYYADQPLVYRNT